MILSEMPVSRVLADLAAELDIPIIVAGLQHQGDVSVVPAAWAADYRTPTTAVPRAGVAVVRGESGGHTHLLLADRGSGVLASVREAVGGVDDLTVAHLLVPAGAVAWLDHPEHGNSGIGAGEYVLRRKREQADIVLLVRD